MIPIWIRNILTNEPEKAYQKHLKASKDLKEVSKPQRYNGTIKTIALIVHELESSKAPDYLKEIAENVGSPEHH